MEIEELKTLTQAVHDDIVELKQGRDSNNKKVKGMEQQVATAMGEIESIQEKTGNIEAKQVKFDDKIIRIEERLEGMKENEKGAEYEELDGEANQLHKLQTIDVSKGRGRNENTDQDIQVEKSRHHEVESILAKDI